VSVNPMVLKWWGLYHGASIATWQCAFKSHAECIGGGVQALAVGLLKLNPIQRRVYYNYILYQ
jgi:hypothetical protein